MTLDELRCKAKLLPLLPGVYLMKDQLGNVIYVGKSKALKNRVSSYFSASQKAKPSKIKRLVKHIHDFEIIETDTELDALVLECRLIKKLQPIYNTLMKQDKKYRFIWIDPDSDLPRMQVAYEQGEVGAYFGPFDMPYLLQMGATAINHYYGLPSCKAPIEKEACLVYRLGQCIGPCDAQGATPQYKNQIASAMSFLQGDDLTILSYYKEKMEEASLSLDFEKAIKYRDYVNILKRLGLRKEAMAFSLANEEHFIVLPVPKGGIKLYRLRGTQIMDTLLLQGEADVEKGKMILMNRRQEEAPISKRDALGKSEIDEAQIIYFYIS